MSLARDAARVKLIGGFKTIDEGHVDTWPEVAAADIRLSRYGYEHFPRGRVNWRGEDKSFLLLADPVVFKLDLHKVVIDRWNLSGHSIQLLTDPHYQTNKLPSFFSRREHA